MAHVLCLPLMLWVRWGAPMEAAPLLDTLLSLRTSPVTFFLLRHQSFHSLLVCSASFLKHFQLLERSPLFLFFSLHWLLLLISRAGPSLLANPFILGNNRTEYSALFSSGSVPTPLVISSSNGFKYYLCVDNSHI